MHLDIYRPSRTQNLNVPILFSYKRHINAMKDISLSTHGGHTFDMGDNKAMAMRDYIRNTSNKCP